ncbi:MAG: hypothetical protein ACR2OX_04545 [Methyloligellaceae bacterium]
MLRVLVTGFVMLITLAGRAFAFEQTEVLPKTTPEAAEAAVAPKVDATAPAVDLTTPGELAEKETGPTISLPGIGKIGTLPKFDFGLELLYGEDEKIVTPDEEADNSDLRIRGSVKHKF